jgi:hypothetical protein
MLELKRLAGASHLVNSYSSQLHICLYDILDMAVWVLTSAAEECTSGVQRCCNLITICIDMYVLSSRNSAQAGGCRSEIAASDPTSRFAAVIVSVTYALFASQLLFPTQLFPPVNFAFFSSGEAG